MNKKLLTVAVAAALAAPVAMADVQITGTANVSLNYITADDVAGAPLDGSVYVADGNSNIVFKGSEDLGNGLKAIWQITTFVDFDDGGDTWANGNTFVGIASDWGTVLLGRHDTPYKMSTGRLDLFANTFADYNNVMGRSWSPISAADGTINNFDLRPDNVIAYVSPDFNGFSGVAAYVVDENNNGDPADLTRNASAWSIAGTYANGPIFVTAAYEQHDSVWGDINRTTGLPDSWDEDAWKIGGSYTFGNFQFGAMWESISSGAIGWLGFEPISHDNWMLNGSYTMGNNVFKVQYLNAGGFDGDSIGVLGNSGADMWALGIDHNFSKRTKVYALYAQMNNDGGALNGLNGYGLGTGVNFFVTPTEGGGNVDGFGVGIQHKF